MMRRRHPASATFPSRSIGNPLNFQVSRTSSNYVARHQAELSAATLHNVLRSVSE